MPLKHIRTIVEVGTGAATRADRSMDRVVEKAANRLAKVRLDVDDTDARCGNSSSTLQIVQSKLDDMRMTVDASLSALGPQLTAQLVSTIEDCNKLLGNAANNQTELHAAHRADRSATHEYTDALRDQVAGLQSVLGQQVKAIQDVAAQADHLDHLLCWCRSVVLRVMAERLRWQQETGGVALHEAHGGDEAASFVQRCRSALQKLDESDGTAIANDAVIRRTAEHHSPQHVTGMVVRTSLDTVDAVSDRFFARVESKRPEAFVSTKEEIGLLRELLNATLTESEKDFLPVAAPKEIVTRPQLAALLRGASSINAMNRALRSAFIDEIRSMGELFQDVGRRADTQFTDFHSSQRQLFRTWEAERRAQEASARASNVARSRDVAVQTSDLVAAAASALMGKLGQQQSQTKFNASAAKGHPSILSGNSAADADGGDADGEDNAGNDNAMDASHSGGGGGGSDRAAEGPSSTSGDAAAASATTVSPTGGLGGAELAILGTAAGDRKHSTTSSGNTSKAVSTTTSSHHDKNSSTTTTSRRHSRSTGHSQQQQQQQQQSRDDYYYSPLTKEPPRPSSMFHQPTVPRKPVIHNNTQYQQSRRPSRHVSPSNNNNTSPSRGRAAGGAGRGGSRKSSSSTQQGGGGSWKWVPDPQKVINAILAAQEKQKQQQMLEEEERMKQKQTEEENQETTTASSLAAAGDAGDHDGKSSKSKGEPTSVPDESQDLDSRVSSILDQLLRAGVSDQSTIDDLMKKRENKQKEDESESAATAGGDESKSNDLSAADKTALVDGVSQAAAGDATLVSDWGSWQPQKPGPGAAKSGRTGSISRNTTPGLPPAPPPPPPIDVSWLKTFVDIANRRGVVIGPDALVKEFMGQGIQVTAETATTSSATGEEGGAAAAASGRDAAPGALGPDDTGAFDATAAANASALTAIGGDDRDHDHDHDDHDDDRDVQQEHRQHDGDGTPAYMRGTAVSEIKKTHGGGGGGGQNQEAGGTGEQDSDQQQQQHEHDDVGALNRPTDGGQDIGAGVRGGRILTNNQKQQQQQQGHEYDDDSTPIQAPPAMSDVIPAGLISMMQAHSDSHTGRSTGVSWTRAIYHAGGGLELSLPTIDIGKTLERIEKTTTDSTMRMLDRRMERQSKLADATSVRLRGAMDYVETLERKSDGLVTEYLIQRDRSPRSTGGGDEKQPVQDVDEYSRQQMQQFQAQTARGDSDPAFRIGMEDQPRSQTSRLPKASRLRKL